MKKIKKNLTLIIMTCSLFFIGAALNAQTFVRHYDHFVKKDRITNKISDIQQVDLKVIFSGNDKGDIIMYFDSGLNIHADRYYKTGKIYDGVSKDGLTYRYIETYNEKKEKVIMQLFDNGVFRVHGQETTYEYQQASN